MREEFSVVTLLFRILAAGAIGGVAYLLVHSALRPRGWPLQIAVSEYENYFTVAVAALVFVLVLWRLIRNTWSKEQIHKLFDTDDAGY